MTVDSIMELMRGGLLLTFLVAAPLLVSALVIGFGIGLIQAATQINEMTLSFIPKLLGMALTLLLAGGWMLEKMVSYTRQLFTELPFLIG